MLNSWFGNVEKGIKQHEIGSSLHREENNKRIKYKQICFS